MNDRRMSHASHKLQYTRSLIEQVPFLSIISSAERSNLAGLGRCRSIKRDHFVFREGDDALHGLFLIQGIVALTARGAKDQAIGIEVITPREPFGLLAVINRIPYPLSALAISPLVVLELPGTEMVALVERYHELKSQLLIMAATRFAEARHVIRTLSGASARSRLAYALTLLAARLGSAHCASCSLPVSRKQLAQLAGTTIETCIRELKHLEYQGLLKFPRLRTVEVVDLRALQALAA